jgi:hypothetical protein
MPLFIDALKQYNKSQTKWTVPMKGTEDYDEVMKIMNDIKKKRLINAKATNKAPKQNKVEQSN